MIDYNTRICVYFYSIAPADTQVGDLVKFSDAFNQGTIDEYHNDTNAVGIDTGGYGRIWYNADTFLKK